MNDSIQIKNSSFLRPGFFIWILVWTFVAIPSAEAHKVSSASVLVEIDTRKHTYQVGAAMEVAPSEDQALNDLISPEEAARTFAEDYLTILFDKDEQNPALEIHTETASDKDTPPELQRKQVIVNLSGKIPQNAKEFILYIDTRCPMAVVMVYIKDNQPARRMQVVLPGEFSRPFNAEPVIEGDPFEETTPVPEAEPVLVVEAPKPPEKKETSKVETSFLKGWKCFLGGTLLHLALLTAILLFGPDWRTIFRHVALLWAGQTIGMAYLAENGIISSPDSLSCVLAAGMIFFAVASILRKNERAVPFQKWWSISVPVVGLIQGIYLFSSTSVSGSDLGRFRNGFSVAEALSAGIIGLLLHFLIKQKWYRSGVALPVAVILAGYGLFLLIEDLI